MPTEHNNTAASLPETLREAIREEAKTIKHSLPQRLAEDMTRDMSTLLEGPFARMVELELDTFEMDPEFEADNPHRDDLRIAMWVLALAVNVRNPQDIANARKDIEEILDSDPRIVRQFRIPMALVHTLQHLSTIANRLLEVPVTRRIAAYLREHGKLDAAAEAEQVYAYAKRRYDAANYALDALAQTEAVENLCEELNITVADTDESTNLP